MKEDQRVTLTKSLLRDAVFRILKEKDLDQIGVTQLCREAGINRATFYRHYNEPKDVVREAQRKIYNDILMFAKKDEARKDPAVWMEHTCEYFRRNTSIMKGLFRCRTDERFTELFETLWAEHFLMVRGNGYGTRMDDEEMKLATYYYFGGVIYLIRHWIMDDIDKSPREVAALINYIMTPKKP